MSVTSVPTRNFVGELFDVGARAHLDDLSQLADELQGVPKPVSPEVRARLTPDLAAANKDLAKANKLLRRNWDWQAFSPHSVRSGNKAARIGAARLERFGQRTDIPQEMRPALTDAIEAAQAIPRAKYRSADSTAAKDASQAAFSKASKVEQSLNGAGFKPPQPSRAEVIERLDASINELGTTLETYVDELHPEALTRAVSGIEKALEAARTLNQLGPTDAIPSSVGKHVREAVDLLERAAADSNRKDLSEAEGVVERLRTAAARTASDGGDA